MLRRLALVIGLALLFTPLAQADDKDKEPENYVKVEVKGKLRTGIVAIGGETTGIVISTTQGVAWELDFGKNKELREQAEKLNGKTVIVKGDLTIRRAVELRRPRSIVQVSSLKAAD